MKNPCGLHDGKQRVERIAEEPIHHSSNIRMETEMAIETDWKEINTNKNAYNHIKKRKRETIKQEHEAKPFSRNDGEHSIDKRTKEESYIKTENNGGDPKENGNERNNPKEASAQHKTDTSYNNAKKESRSCTKRGEVNHARKKELEEIQNSKLIENRTATGLNIYSQDANIICTNIETSTPNINNVSTRAALK